MPRLESLNVLIKLPFLELAGKWSPDTSERDAAWELYVELLTRITVVELGPTEGTLREALSSLYALFPITREVLRRYGPAVSKPKRSGELSLATIAVAILNYGLRPFLAKWHPELLAPDAARPADVSAVEHERKWQHAGELRTQLTEMQTWISAYAHTLGEAAGVTPLLPESPKRA
jgi:hypothetical protein